MALEAVEQEAMDEFAVQQAKAHMQEVLGTGRPPQPAAGQIPFRVGMIICVLH